MKNGRDVARAVRLRRDISREELAFLLETEDGNAREGLRCEAQEEARAAFGGDIYIRGLIEFTNYCRNDCYYCGIRRGNASASRYRLSKEEIMSCCEQGHALGFRTFVLQGGEDPYFTDEAVCDIVSSIRAAYPDCAITLSIGERERGSYEAFYRAGANRYLLRHETADAGHYGMLHPAEMSLSHRMQCLRDLKEIGYQTGCGFMVGSPGQTIDTLYADLRFILDLRPEMVGIGPFIPQKDTPFGGEAPGTLDRTLRLISVLRLLLPNALIPATTALGTIHPKGREMGILAGANVVMPNLSPVSVREKYALYDHKICTGDEAAECRACLDRRVAAIGYRVVTARGDYGEHGAASAERPSA